MHQRRQGKKHPLQVGFACVAALALCLGASLVQAQGTAPGGLQGFVRLHSANPIGQAILEPGVISQGHSLVDSAGVRHYMLINELQFGYGVSRIFEIGASLPLRAWRVSAEADSTVQPRDLVGFGDLLLSAKIRLPFPWKHLRLAGLGRVSLPTGSRSRGFSSESTDFEAGALMTFDFSDLQNFPPTRIHLNATYRWNRNEANGVGMSSLHTGVSDGFWPPAYPAVPDGKSSSWNDHLLLRAGVDFSTRIMVLFTEVSADLLPNVDEINFRDNVMMLTPGVMLKFRNGLNLKMAVDVSLQEPDPSTEFVPEIPNSRFWLGLSWHFPLANRDSDHDGIPDKHDACPKQAEDYDGYQDDDGCPEYDNDGDGVPDDQDLAPDLAEDMDGFEDEDGRPDLDNDGDGIADADDACPDEAEDFDGDRDTDGCPDVLQDGDADGIPDDVDQCPTEAEDIDGFEDEDGCPDPDNDGDGIPDAQDACPDEAETQNGYLDDDGCPDSDLYRNGEVLDGLKFDSGSAKLTSGAKRSLGGLLQALQDNPTLRIELRGYTDNQGSATRNLELSEQRAEAVRSWLIQQGIEARRIQSRGLGAANPVASNNNDAGRAKNRRIEVWGR
jgi:outer membrane protein OmpA-like peptidoglycan-associated protein